ncbi:MAG: methyltransferase [Thermogutta sp.]|nr:MAG: methyltransferase [Thermogutta sp.]
MTPRQRVLTALEHKEPDRVPIDFGGHRSSGIAAIAYARLRKFLGLPDHPIRVYDPIQQLAVIDEDILDLFHVDTIELGRAFAQETEYWVDWVLPDGTPCQMPNWAVPERHDNEWVLRGPTGQILGRMPDGALYFEQCYWPFAEKDNPDRAADALKHTIWCGIPSPPGPIVEGPGGLERLQKGAQCLRQKTDRAILYLFGGNLLECGQFLYRNDNFYMLLAGDRPRAERVLDRLTEAHLANLERVLPVLDGFVDIIVFGDDLGMQTGPQISPKMYRELFKPRHAAMWKRAKELADVKVMLHCCGGVRELLDDLIDAGLDAINPVQISCKGMDPEGLKRDFGRRITFWGGGCDTHQTLAFSTPAQIKEHVRHLIEILAPGGGFVFQQVHNILADVPPENIVAMFEAAYAFGAYGSRKNDSPSSAVPRSA